MYYTKSGRIPSCMSSIPTPTIANYSLISLWFYVLCQKLQKCCNDISVLKRAYLYNHWFKSYELKSIRKPRRGMLLHLYNAKCDYYAVKCYITSNPKLPNIAMLLEPTVAINRILSQPFQVMRGVRQGDPLLCALFDLAIKPVACKIWNDNKLKGYRISEIKEKIIISVVSCCLSGQFVV